MGRLAKISAVCSTIAAALLISAWLLSAQNSAQEAKAAPATSAPATPPIYNPYPTGILPSDLTSELLRVRAKLPSSKMKLSDNGTPYRPRL
jgi:hypothetical protein